MLNGTCAIATAITATGAAAAASDTDTGTTDASGRTEVFIQTLGG